VYKLLKNLATCSIMESFTPEGWIIVDVRDISDVERDIKKIIKKLEICCGLMTLGQKVCIRCVAGINRSNAIAMGLLCWFKPVGDIDETWDYHLNKLRELCPRAMITPELERIVKKAVVQLRKNNMKHLKDINLR